MRNFLLLVVVTICSIMCGLQDAHADKVADKVMPGSTAGGEAYRIGVGDVVEVLVWKEEELSRPGLIVRLDGKISLPLIGDVAAAGKTTVELAAHIEERLREILAEPAVSVILTDSRSRRYYIVGQIAKPGEFALDSHLTVLQAIARSGGFLEWAKKSKIAVIRRDAGREKILKFDYEALVNGDDLSQNIFIAPGDTIIVP